MSSELAGCSVKGLEQNVYFLTSDTEPVLSVLWRICKL